MAKIREFEWDFAHQLVQDLFHSSCWDFTQDVSGAFERWPGPSRVGFVDVSPMEKMVASWDLHGISRGFCFELVIYQWYEVRKTWMWSVFHGILPWFHGIWMGFFMIYHLDQLALTEIYMEYTVWWSSVAWSSTSSMIFLSRNLDLLRGFYSHVWRV